MAPADALTLLLTGPDQALAAACVAALLAASAVIGVALRRPSVEGAAFGLLILAGGSALALFALRASSAPLVWMGPLTLVFVAGLTVILRVWALPPPLSTARPPITRAELLLMAAVLSAFWTLRILQIDPSSGLSSQLGWTPLYMQSSFAAGRFLLPTDFQFGVGPADSLFYAVDMAGLVALAGWAGIERLYPAYLATSLAGTGLALALLLGALRGKPAAQLTFLGLMAGLAVMDGQVQAAVLRHWGDTVLILGGALIMVSLTRVGDDLLPALRVAAAASVFLVLARHYGAFFSAALMAFGLIAALVADRRATLKAWPAALALAALLVILSVREVHYIFDPAPYYPGSKLLALTKGGFAYHVEGALHDWGLMSDGRWLIGPRIIWLPAMVALLVIGWRRRGMALAPLLAPAAVMALPALLHILTGYRSSGHSNKPYLLATFFMAWYPAYAVSVLAGAGRLDDAARRVVRWGGSALALGLAGWVLIGPWAGWGPGRLLGWGANLYRGHIVDLNVARAAAETGIDLSGLSGQPLMYFYCEPGIGLRNYIGGDLRRDLDFWGATVQDRLAEGQEFTRILADLGWPNLYFSSRNHYGSYVDGDWQSHLGQLDDLDGQPWVDRVIRHGDARLVIVRPIGP